MTKLLKKVTKGEKVVRKEASGDARLWSDLFGKSGHNERIMTL